MIGFIVKNAAQGVGRIEALQDGNVRVRFFASAEPMTFAMRRVSTGNVPYGIVRISLGLDSSCRTNDGTCRIKKRKLGKGWSEAHRYEVEFDNGRLAELPETELTPVPEEPSEGSIPASPLDTLLHLQHEGHSTFTCRETLLEAYLQTLRGGLGVRALLSSRIDLRPHQAYVAGVVLLDRQSRYLLADEVGLGKTIEAGIVIHDFLARDPNARILILSPGALVQQWLCELYAKFCGRVFRLPELGGASARIGDKAQQIILSFLGAKDRREQLLAAPWDLVVVDEAHHLLATSELYELAQKLSRAARGVLLLSALPAQHREEEYLRLLALLEPDQYHPEACGEAKRFRELYSRQRQLGTVLRWVSRKLPEVADGDREPIDLIEKLNELTTWPILDQDEKLSALVKVLDGLSPTFADDVATVLHHVSDTHRINRRILRNRRARLIEQEQVSPIARSLHRIGYPIDPFEHDAVEHVRRLLVRLQRDGFSDEGLVPLSRLLFQACADSECLTTTLDLGFEVAASPITVDRETLALDALGGYADWTERAIALWQSASSFINEDALNAAREAAVAWCREPEKRARFHTLVAFLKNKHRVNPKAKFLIFAGFPGLAESLFGKLCAEFSPREIARFCFGMPDFEKEEQVRLFCRDKEKWLLVCDETGGEGRNFQFADELVHFDTPWHAARVEQRIGRLDRLGRERLDVVSNVLCAEGSEEDGLVTAFADGLGIYTSSISGLEFALRSVERDLVLAALADGREGIVSLVPAIRQTAQNERTEDESADLFDEASNERRAANAFRRAQSDPKRDKELEHAFIDYFKHIAPGKSVDFIRDGNYPDGIVLFHPEDIRDLKLALPRDETGRMEEPQGTFFRKIAQERPDLKFFSVGNPLFDAVCGTLFTELAGRTYAIETVLHRGQWRGFEFIFRIVPGVASMGSELTLANQLDRIFAFHLERIWVKEDVTLAKSPEQLLAIRRLCQKANKEHGWWNLTKEKGAAIENFYAERGWGQLLAECHDFARSAARERISGLLSETLRNERARLDEQQRQLAALKPPGWTEDSAAIDRLRAALDGWTVELDSVGFFSVNGGLLHQR
jgi:ATP-dependent helicase HepA